MNSQDERRRVQRMKDAYPVGTRIVLLHMADPYAPVPPGIRGTVKYIDDAGTVFSDFDNNRTLGIIPGVDSFRKLTAQELAEEAQTHRTNPVITAITSDELRQMADAEGLILQGCGGDLQDWVEGINGILTQEGILRDGAIFQDIRSFQQEGHTNLLFLFGDVSLDVGKLALCRLQTHDVFHGIWLSDYRTNQLGVHPELEEPAKPLCPLIGQNSNVFNLVGIAARTLKQHGMNTEAKEMSDRVFACGSYEEALGIMGEYVEITSEEDMDIEKDWDMRMQ